MKSQDIYHGAAPSAMSQMGQGLADVGAGIARSIQSGGEAFGKGISGGVQAVGDAYKQYKDMTADVAAKEKAIGLFLPYLPEDKRAPFESKIASVQTDPKMSLADKKAFYDTAFGMLGQSVGHQMTMEKVAAENAAALARTKVGAAASLTGALGPYVIGQKAERPFDPSALVPSEAKPVGQPESMDDRILRVQAYQKYWQNPSATGDDYNQFEQNYLNENRKPR